jgi:DNA modification methylase
MGSGTTGIAALKPKCKFIGIEVNEKEFKTAKANISKFLRLGRPYK